MPRVAPCSICGEPLRLGGGSLPAGVAAHRVCRFPLVHGVNGYNRHGCRCVVCRSAVNEKAKRYTKAYRERTGKSVRGKYRKDDEIRHPIPDRVRRAVYERDGWICQLCFEPVDPSAEQNSSGQASLDHIECATWALIPDHSPANLRLAHKGCNARRGNENRRENALNGRSPGGSGVGKPWRDVEGSAGPAGG